ncbi:DEAD/DEAH box helicase family protein [Patulibacter brassicae]|uniref:DEAD/DEAH box helicase family protein n=1 Tax=Patulibacter brassicae TaxID=1705717 RepID=A0ABU4VJ36_9ACTN|nr:DEAD/DEAH box helicase family protein [Patulibacter brassicae]MDX8151841.1 DEAD/DEAH box helicase family protein [Patulibacter brassicae]
MSAPSNVPELRPWQVQALERMAQWQRGTFLVAAAPGAGKTRPALEHAVRLLYAREADRIALVCPTAPLTRQWAAAAARLGVNLAPDAPELDPPAGFHGVAVTYARVAQSAERWASQCRESTLVIADEAHHLGEELAWGQGFQLALGRARRWLLLSGTPFRSDASPIPGVDYDSDGVAQPDYAYGYADAVRDRVCRPVTFIPFDGAMSWRVGEETVEGSFADDVASDQRAKRYRTAISAELEGALPKILGEAHRRLTGLRETDHPDAGGLVVSADSDHARAVAAVLHRLTGSPPVVVLHTDAQAHRRLAEFTDSSAPWIVAVNMVSEGVDIPRLRVGVYATTAKTAMIFRQIVGRFVRTVPGRPIEGSWLYLPAEPTLRAHAAAVDRELVPLLRRKGEIDPDAPLLDDQALQQANAVEDELLKPDWQALEADMAPAAQLDLFGGATPVADGSASLGTPISPVGTAGGPVPGAAPAAAGGAPAATQEVPLWQRRQKLRDERHRLVAELGRTRRASHREINAWLNGRIGIARVEDATIEQLEQSIEVLYDALAGRA